MSSLLLGPTDVGAFANSLRSCRNRLEILERLSTALMQSVGPCGFSGYVAEVDEYRRVYGDVDGEILPGFEGMRAHGERVAVGLAEAGAVVVLFPAPPPQRVVEFVEALSACAALALSNVGLTDELARIARTDSLTGIANRRFFFEASEREFSLAKRHQSPLSLIMLDIDHLKRINDLHGQEVGDEIVRAVAQKLHTTLRNEDILARFGGEEFVMLLPRINLPEATWGMAERLRKLIEDSHWDTSAGEAVHLTASLGVSTYDDTQNEIKKMLRRAEDGVSMAKTLGRNRCVALDLELMAPEP